MAFLVFGFGPRFGCEVQVHLAAILLVSHAQLHAVPGLQGGREGLPDALLRPSQHWHTLGIVLGRSPTAAPLLAGPGDPEALAAALPLDGDQRAWLQFFDERLGDAVQVAAHSWVHGERTFCGDEGVGCRVCVAQCAAELECALEGHRESVLSFHRWREVFGRHLVAAGQPHLDNELSGLFLPHQIETLQTLAALVEVSLGLSLLVDHPLCQTPQILVGQRPGLLTHHVVNLHTFLSGAGRWCGVVLFIVLLQCLRQHLGRRGQQAILCGGPVLIAERHSLLKRLVQTT
mmetsp:Transcript_16773/g.40251  ORF Transcript_16773/g.40251 Transcript_16773/m.40251 type:complete len:289 (-) Transcript_16773:924-1790(-)